MIVTVLESLRANLQEFNLTAVLEEVHRWMKEGVSMFARRWQALTGTEPATIPNTS